MRGEVKSSSVLPLVALALLIDAIPLPAQGADRWKASAIHAVMDYRASVLADTTAKFDRCRVEQLTASASSPPHNLELHRLMLGPCRSVETPHVVLPDSITGDQSGATVYVRVVRGEWQHFERYTVEPLRGRPEMMWVREMWASAGAQFYPRRPDSAPPE